LPCHAQRLHWEEQARLLLSQCDWERDGLKQIDLPYVSEGAQALNNPCNRHPTATHSAEDVELK